ncbi:hypothetical protein RJZ90_006339 [Blastomyces dermatitidis]
MDGTAWRYNSTWHHLDANGHLSEIAAGGGHLYMRHNNDQVFQYHGTIHWTRICDMDSHAIQIAAGMEGVFKHCQNGGIYKHVSGTSWKKVSGEIANFEIAVEKYLHRAKTENTISRLDFNSTPWQIIRPPTGWHTEKVQPAEQYKSGYAEAQRIWLKIGNVTFVTALADAFTQFKVSQGKSPFKVAWCKSDMTESINYMKNGTVDACITYHAAAEQLAIDQNFARNPSYYAFRERFLLVGPPSNRAKLDSSDSVEEMFQSIYSVAESGKNAPWAQTKSPWYHENAEYPIQALTTAVRLGEYTLTDWGASLSVPHEVQNNLTIYKKGPDKEDDPLLMPAHLLVSDEPPLAKYFAHWLVSKEGQVVVAGFMKDGKHVYSGAP